MKRLVAILLLALLLFNAFGYYALFAYEQGKARRAHIADLPDSAFTVLKVKATLYVHLEDSDFEYTEGGFQHEGKTYNMVKRRVVNDTLEIYCLRDFRQDELNSLIAEYSHQQGIGKADDSQSDAPMKLVLKSFLKEYLPNTPISIVKTPVSTEGGQNLSIPIAAASVLTAGHLSIPSPPPNA
jgi:hypothetical protein